MTSMPFQHKQRSRALVRQWLALVWLLSDTFWYLALSSFLCCLPWRVGSGPQASRCQLTASCLNPTLRTLAGIDSVWPLPLGQQLFIFSLENKNVMLSMDAGHQLHKALVPVEDGKDQGTFSAFAFQHSFLSEFWFGFWGLQLLWEWWAMKW